MATSRRALIVALPMMAAALFSARTAFAAGPQVLSPMDERAYREAFAAAQRGDFEDADGALTKVKDRSLAGHLAFQKLMHPTAWSATYEELTGWLKHYGDHPGAERVYALAVKRKPGNAADPNRAGLASRFHGERRITRASTTGVTTRRLCLSPVRTNSAASVTL